MTDGETARDISKSSLPARRSGNAANLLMLIMPFSQLSIASNRYQQPRP
jgi:hypothetical protein